jgi:hypothetical protein
MSNVNAIILMIISSSGDISNADVELNTANTLIEVDPYKKYPPINVITEENNINVITKNIVARSFAVRIFDLLYGLTRSSLIVPLSVSAVIKLQTSIIANIIIITVQSSRVKYI